MKVNENAALIPPNSGVGKTNPGSNSTSVNPGANKVATDVVAGPAVNLDISLTAKLAEVQSDNASKVSDEALIEKLRNQVANGEFKIDYQKISQAMLKDVVASIGQKPKQA
ncbi:flagellar biosynthesis anti-sigma factor FlgM [Polynucleobacter sp. UB-Piko-W3]|jgi:flagellar biosynthesis anti-sigma factor FlgM|uniref:flagellar biosynthesis anti-sigma factor FlgM n=1 Tax=Polynucleobacter sp. UB-Piko-W3 TaxID=1819735 RepID=UPI001C0BFF06|nr:flagellar biosynthesis anti-sigma factor FlgM [Polynucleobacter sp. UB-Piko-W3]MBU3554995.1 flagellar biosynthesis anti-sigma factor FlgM [Polynucleobacter sp. UB-Piko-W3]